MLHQIVPDEARRTPVHSLLRVGRTVWAASGRRVYVYSVDAVLALSLHERAVADASVASARRRLVIGGADGSIEAHAAVPPRRSALPLHPAAPNAAAAAAPQRNKNDLFMLRSFQVEEIDSGSAEQHDLAASAAAAAATARRTASARTPQKASNAISAMCCTGEQVWCAVGAVTLVYAAVATPLPLSTTGAAPAQQSAGGALAHALLKIVIGHAAPIQTLLYCSEFDVVWSGDSDGALYVWSAQEYDCVRCIEAAHGGVILSLVEVELVLNDQFLREM